MEPKVGQTGFKIDSAASANALLRELRRIDAKRAREIARHSAAASAIESEGLRLLERYEADLQEWVRVEIAGKARSLKLPAGVCAFRHVAASVRVIDNEAAMAYARAHRLGKLVQRIVSFHLDSLAYRALARKALEKSGTLLPGIDSLPAHETFSIKLGG